MPLRINIAVWANAIISNFAILTLLQIVDCLPGLIC